MPCGLKLKISGSNTQGMTLLKLGETGEFKSPNFFSGDSARGLSYFEMLGGGGTFTFWPLIYKQFNFLFPFVFQKDV